MTDECGDDVLVKQFKVPEIEWDDLDVETDEDDINPAEMMLDMWKDKVLEHYGKKYPENRGFRFERPYDTYSLSQLQAMAELDNISNYY